MSGEHEAVESLERLGLSNYEARVFVALQKLGSGTAREVHQVADVPRSQVYGAADELEERGLVEIQQSTPKRYRPVSLDTARRLLSARLEREQERAFDSLEQIQQQRTDVEQRDDVWTVRGRETISDRIVDLATRATDRIVFGTPTPDLVTDEIRETLRERANAGIRVRIISESETVRSHFSDELFDVISVPQKPPDFAGRILICDDDIMLMSVLGESDLPDVQEETAFWSAETALARVLVQFTRGGLEQVLRRQ